MKSKPVAYLLWLCLGVLGIHRFYCKKWFSGALYFCTGGLLIIGWLMDIVKISRMVDEANGIVREPSPASSSGSAVGGAGSPATGVLKWMWNKNKEQMAQDKANRIESDKQQQAARRAAADRRYTCKFCGYSTSQAHRGTCSASPHGNHEYI